MAERGRLSVFLIVALAIWTAMHAYVVWRLAGVPSVAEHLSPRALIAVAASLGFAYFVGRLFDRRGFEWLARPLEVAGALWIGVLFLLVVCLLVADIVTGFGLLLPGKAPAVRTVAFLSALGLAAIGVVQAVRPPVVREYEVTVPGLPAGRDGTVVVQLSDLHLGTILGDRWLAARLAQVERLRPDLVVVTGDLVDGHARHAATLVPELRRLLAPLGVWAVTGNHEFYAGLDGSLAVLRDAGFQVLRDGWREAAPGIVLAGVDDLTARRQSRRPGTPLAQALAGRPAGATILLSHSPLGVDEAAACGVGLMLSGHTHGGQIWPFSLLVARSYPYLGGRYEVGGMQLVVSRGTGTWGPRLRLWRPGEIVRILLRSPAAATTAG